MPRTYAFYVVKDQLDGTLMYHRGELFGFSGVGSLDRRVSASWRERWAAVEFLHRHRLHVDGWRILKLEVPDARA